jgi:hypothetical protein
MKEKPILEEEIYTNKSLKQKLGIGDRVLKQLRDNGFLGYSRVNDKYWYSRKDVEMFLELTHFEPFAASPNPLHN